MIFHDPDTMQMNGFKPGEALLILHCRIEKDRIKHTLALIKKIEGVLEVDLLESIGKNMVKL